jgi:hypothetical protein
MDTLKETIEVIKKYHRANFEEREVYNFSVYADEMFTYVNIGGADSEQYDITIITKDMLFESINMDSLESIKGIEFIDYTAYNESGSELIARWRVEDEPINHKSLLRLGFEMINEIDEWEGYACEYILGDWDIVFDNNFKCKYKHIKDIRQVKELYFNTTGKEL